MNRKPASSAKAAELREFGARMEHHPMMAELYRRAEARLRKQQKLQRSPTGGPKSDADARRLFHELQVHQVELEMQNAELQEGRNRMEILLEKYTDLYDFAPVGYFSLDEQARIIEVNLTGVVRT